VGVGVQRLAGTRVAEPCLHDLDALPCLINKLA
jgi:hypothetical protein